MKVAPTRRRIEASLGKMPTTSVRRLISRLSCSIRWPLGECRHSPRDGFVEGNFVAVLPGKGHVGEDVLLSPRP